MLTILPKKATQEYPIATDDEAAAQLAMDPSIPQFAPPILTNSAPTNAASNADILVANTNEHWLNSHWRPAAGWIYLVICIFDFILFPIGWGILQLIAHQVNVMWQPLTLQGGGLFHISFGALLGITSYGRSKEKIAGVNNV